MSSTSTPRRVPIWATGEPCSPVDLQIRKLCIATLESAINDLRVTATTRISRSANNPNPDIEREWLSSDMIRPMSFVWLCQVLDLEPDATRSAIDDLVRAPAPSMAPGRDD